MSQNHEEAKLPRVGILYCGGAMSSVGELTGVAAFEAMKRLGSNVVGMACVSALASGVSKHLSTLENIEKVLVIDGCANYCLRKLMEQISVKMDGYINLCMDLKLKKIGPFKPLDYSQEDLQSAVEAIIIKIKNLLEVTDGDEI